MVPDCAEHFELVWVIDSCFYPGDAAFVIGPDAVGFQLELHPAANGAVFIAGDCFSLKPRVRFAPHKGEDIGAVQIIKGVSNQRGVDIL